MRNSFEQTEMIFFAKKPQYHSVKAVIQEPQEKDWGLSKQTPNFFKSGIVLD
ncbi:hypothetical protein NEPTK9_000951 [Candidatus Neptunochlamydia vexilliferae]|uniref:Uncharacterized protein n=1 Tax=Candidatus Neptunichlamydia vexilliferae TaxID=1651774 RepID=A0ABS0B0R9_9BACT|nr:hypothetical protein [Candidatus Neptunochlamydia vexilliferae]